MVQDLLKKCAQSMFCYVRDLGYHPVNIHLALKHDDGLPLDYDTYNGSINDMSQCNIMVERLHDFGYKNIGCIFDRGYYFEDVIRWLDKMEYPKKLNDPKA